MAIGICVLLVGNIWEIKMSQELSKSNVETQLHYYFLTNSIHPILDGLWDSYLNALLENCGNTDKAIERLSRQLKYLFNVRLGHMQSKLSPPILKDIERVAARINWEEIASVLIKNKLKLKLDDNSNN